jgi:tetratricopeptide (TPR) repeat protein
MVSAVPISKGQKSYSAKAIEFFEKALAIARQEKMEDETGAAQLQLADIYLAVPDKDKALKYITEAFSRINTLKNDSLKVEANIEYGKVYQSRNERIMSLRHFLTALRLAEEINATKARHAKNESRADA